MRGQRDCVKVPNTSYTSGDIPEQPVRPSDPPEASPCQRASGQPNAWCKMMAKDAFGSLKIDKKRCCDDYVGDRLTNILFPTAILGGKELFLGLIKSKISGTNFRQLSKGRASAAI